MITLTRFNHTQLVVNADLIESIETTPDTVVTLVTSKKILVLETAEEIVQRVLDYRKSAGAPFLRLNSAHCSPSEAKADA